MGIVHQNLRDIALTERQTGLQQVPAVGAHDDHDPPGYSGRKRQLIETVAVHAAGPNGGEGALDFTLQRLETGRRRRLHDQFQVLNPGAPAAGEFQFVGPFGNHLEAHVFQHRQQVGNGNGILIAEDLQEESVLAPRLGSINIQMQACRFLLDGLEERHIQGSRVAMKILRIGGGKCPGILLEQLQGVGFVEARQKCCLEPVRP